MGVLIYSDKEDIHIGLPPVLVTGIQEHYRGYKAKGHYIHVESANGDLVYHDVQQILKLQGFRLAEPDEQNDYFAAKKHHVLTETSGEEALQNEEPKRTYRKRG